MDEVTEENQDGSDTEEKLARTLNWTTRTDHPREAVFHCCRDASKSVLENLRLRDCVILALIFRTFDLIFLFNIIGLWTNYKKNGLHSYYLTTLLLYVLPASLFVIITIGRAVYYCCGKSGGKTGHTDGASWKVFLYSVPCFALFPSIGAFVRARLLTRERLKSSEVNLQNQERCRLHLIHFTDEMTAYYLMTNFIQSTTQFFFQWYVLTTMNNEFSESAPTNGPLQKLCIIWSIFSLACTMTASEESLIRIHYGAITITLFWKLFSLTSRMIVLALCLTVCVPLFIGICVGQWAIFTLLIALLSKHLSLLQRVCLSPILGVVYIITTLPLSFPKYFCQRLIFYALDFMQGTAAMAVWIIKSDLNVWQCYWVSVGIYVSFFLGVFFFRFWYEFEHSKLRPKHIQTTKRLHSYVFNCCLNYPDYDNIEDTIEEEPNWEENSTTSRV